MTGAGRGDSRMRDLRHPREVGARSAWGKGADSLVGRLSDAWEAGIQMPGLLTGHIPRDLAARCLGIWTPDA